MGITGLSLKRGRMAKKWQREHKNAELSAVLWHYPNHRLWEVPKPEWNWDCWQEFFKLEEEIANKQKI
jgi:hypothetical protein